ncbi:MAG: hypothetical protein MUF21_14270, partial [Gemmatimonadaceae bacterium]|nr:hypothetical protein [Gemmatimonadaceae bacterium]
TIAFLDACAVVDDVLTFHQERFAQESWLRTATERLSLVQLARSVGHEPRPGVAAGTWLAFTIDDTPGTPEFTTIDAGTRVLSIPGTNELPQPYETVEAITARALWNAMPARSLRPQAISSTMTTVVLRGVDTGVRQGDRVLLVAGTTTEARAPRVVQRVVADPAAGTTTLTIGAIPRASGPEPLPFTWSWTGDDTNEIAPSDFFGIGTSTFLQLQVSLALYNTPRITVDTGDIGVHVFRQRAASFGHNAPRWRDLPQVVQGVDGLVPGRLLTAGQLDDAQYPDDWDDLALDDAAGASGALDLDNLYPQVVAGSWLLAERDDGTWGVAQVASTREVSRADFALSARVTRCELTTGIALADFPMRATAVHARSEPLPLARVAIDGPVQGDTITLDRYYPDLVAGRAVLVSGFRDDLPTLEWHEARTVLRVDVNATEFPEDGRLFTTLVLDHALDHAYLRTTVRVNANVAFATHGESKAEVLGGGDGAQRFRTFTLRQPPLTHVPAATETGAQSTLELRVDGILWQQRADLLDRPADERSYVVRVDDDGKTRITCNAVVPTGLENVTATYRRGIGLAGRVKERQLSLLASRPLGVRSVVNPIAAEGGEDPEPASAIRVTAGLQGLTLGRLVTLTDYRDFARAFAGFARAHATMTSDGERAGIFVTVAPTGGVPISESSAPFVALKSAMTSYGDPHVSFTVRAFTPAVFTLAATVAIDPAFLADDVTAAIDARLRAEYGFDARDFGESVAASALVAAMQSPAGAPPARLAASVPLPGVRATLAQPAELLVLAARPLTLAIVTGG